MQDIAYCSVGDLFVSKTLSSTLFFFRSMHFSHYFTIPTVQKKKFSIKDFFSKLKKKFGQCRQKSCESLLNAFIAIKWYDNEVAK